MWSDVESALPWLTRQIEERFPKYKFRFGAERKMEEDVTVLLVQYSKLSMFERMQHDPTVEVFMVRTREDLINLRDKVIARLMLLGL